MENFAIWEKIRSLEARTSFLVLNYAYTRWWRWACNVQLVFHAKVHSTSDERRSGSVEFVQDDPTEFLQRSLMQRHRENHLVHFISLSLIKKFEAIYANWKKCCTELRCNNSQFSEIYDRIERDETDENIKGIVYIIIAKNNIEKCVKICQRHRKTAVLFVCLEVAAWKEGKAKRFVMIAQTHCSVNTRERKNVYKHIKIQLSCELELKEILKIHE